MLIILLWPAMNVTFADDNLDRLETDPSFDDGLPGPVVKMFRKRLGTIRAAPNEQDFYQLRSLHYEKLKGKRRNQHSMRLNQQWRLIVEIKNAPSGKTVHVIGIEDYH